MLCIVFKVPPNLIGSQYEKLIIQKLNVTLDIISDYHGHTSIPAHRIPHCRQQDQAKVRVADRGEQILREQQKLFAMEYGAKLQEILVRYSDKYHTYYADDEKINLENFAAGKIDCLLTCKKVSEGIDISSVTNIILFSSDRSRLVTTQRIGRALRLDKNNPEKKATVVDFVIEDSEENDNNADADRAEWLTELSQTRRCEHEK